eukprot:CAMPEP_0168594102 /NCGR_PEP_ID=MMETSP0420-20121227/8702_1 /TAXON_ID=498008 /ORGANISM="Pessonella sp." /LENGTH=90 /DNA_ID=CAMNT_0008630365 /DNA_START=771 /DNA_END=1040 /DNA_ORIENTATION=-
MSDCAHTTLSFKIVEPFFAVSAALYTSAVDSGIHEALALDYLGTSLDAWGRALLAGESQNSDTLSTSPRSMESTPDDDDNDDNNDDDDDD